MNTVSERRVITSLSLLKRPGKGLLVAYFALSLFAIFYIPYFFPVRPSTSDSYIFGYNNSVGILLVLLLVSIGATWTKGFNFNFTPSGPSSKVSQKYLWLGLAIELAACIGMWLGVLRYGPLGELVYPASRVWLLSQGKHPFTDFEWSYGSGLLYGPKWIAFFLHINVFDAYFLFWTMISVFSIVLLYATINLIDFPSRHKTKIFLVFTACAVLGVPNMGTYYALLRYICALYFILHIYRLNRRSLRLAARIRVGILAVAFAVILSWISPEVTIAFVFASAVCLFPTRSALSLAKQFGIYFATLISFAGVFAYGFISHSFDAVLDKGQGSTSFPIISAPSTLLFLASLFVCACYVVQRASRAEIQDNTIALIIFSVPMTAAALNRCDPGHLLLNGMGILLAVLFYASASERMWRFFYRSFIVCFFVISPALGIAGLIHLFLQPARPRFPAVASLRSLYPTKTNPGGDGMFQAPFGYWPEASGFFVSPEIDYGYYKDVLNACSRESYRRKIAELAQHPDRDLLLRKGVLGVCEVHDHTERVSVSMVLDFPYAARVVHHESVRKPLCDFIRDHYVLAVPATPENFYYELWSPKPDAADNRALSQYGRGRNAWLMQPDLP